MIFVWKFFLRRRAWNYSHLQIASKENENSKTSQQPPTVQKWVLYFQWQEVRAQDHDLSKTQTNHVHIKIPMDLRSKLWRILKKFDSFFEIKFWNKNNKNTC